MVLQSQFSKLFCLHCASHPLFLIQANECDIMMADDILHAALLLQHFDVAIVDYIFSCGFLYAGRLGIPVIVLECGSQLSTLADMPDPHPLAYVPVDMTGLSHHMTFWERIRNTCRYIYIFLLYEIPILGTHNIY